MSRRMRRRRARDTLDAMAASKKVRQRTTGKSAHKAAAPKDFLGYEKKGEWRALCPLCVSDVPLKYDLPSTEIGVKLLSLATRLARIARGQPLDAGDGNPAQVARILKAFADVDTASQTEDLMRTKFLLREIHRSSPRIIARIGAATADANRSVSAASRVRVEEDLDGWKRIVVGRILREYEFLFGNIANGDAARASFVAAAESWQRDKGRTGWRAATEHALKNFGVQNQIPSIANLRSEIRKSEPISTQYPKP